MDVAGAAARGDPATLNADKRKHRRVERATELLGQNAKPLGALLSHFALALARILRDRFCNGLVEAEAERPELSPRDGRILLDREVCHGLADVAVIVNH